MLAIVYQNLGGVFYGLVFILGCAVGSFLNSWIWRARENIKVLAVTRSMCYHCRRQLRWYENIPLISFIWLKRRCATCRGAIPWRYFWMELFTGAGLTLVAWYHTEMMGEISGQMLLFHYILLALLIVIFIYDFLYQEVISDVVWIGTLVGLYYAIIFQQIAVSKILLGIILGGGFFLVQYLVSRGRWVGGGDVRLGVMMGAWLAWPGVLAALFIAYIGGAIFAIILLLTKKSQWGAKLPMGCFLTVATFIAVHESERIISWYWGLLR